MTSPDPQTPRSRILAAFVGDEDFNGFSDEEAESDASPCASSQPIDISRFLAEEDTVPVATFYPTPAVASPAPVPIASRPRLVRDFNINESYQFGDFMRDVVEMRMNREEFMDRARRVFRIIVGRDKPYLLKLADNPFHISGAAGIKAIPGLVTISHHHKDANGQWVDADIPVCSLLKAPDQGLVADRLYCEPVHVEQQITHKKGLNTFPGWGAKRFLPESEINMTFVKRWNELLLRVVCGGDEAMLHQFQSWIAMPIQKPGLKTCVAPILQSDENGVGKSTIIDTLAEIYGLKNGTGYGVVADKLEHVAGEKNKLIKNRGFIGFNEANREDNVTATLSAGFITQIQRMISEGYLVIRELFVDGLSQRNFYNLIFAVNHWESLRCSDTRRFWWIRCVLHFVGKEYWTFWKTIWARDGLGNYVDTRAQHYVDSLYSYYRRYALTEFFEAPKTAFGKEVLEAAKNRDEIFIDQLIAGELANWKDAYEVIEEKDGVPSVKVFPEEPLLRHTVEGGLWALKDEVYAIYCRWIANRRYDKPTCADWFWRRCVKRVQQTSVRPGTGNRKRKHYARWTVVPDS